MATIVKTVGTASRDYTTWLTWAAALPANLVTDGNSQEGQGYNDAAFDDGQISISGHTTDPTHTITMTTGAGQSFRDNANVQTNALNYNQANGVAITRSVAASTAIVVGADYVSIKNLQIKHTVGYALKSTSGLATHHLTVDNCILVGGTTSGSVYAFENGDVVRNSLMVRQAQGDANSSVIENNAVNPAVSIHFCDLVAPSDITAPAQGIFLDPGSSITTKNCAFFGFAAVNGATGTYTHTTGMSDVASPPTGVTGSKTYANQFQNTTLASGDYRVKLGADLIDAATADSTNGATDIVGTARPQGVGWDIGCWELQYMPLMGAMVM